MAEESFTESLFDELSTLYSDMEAAYNRLAARLGLSCTGCSDNCCTSYFLHHTHVEWGYLWNGIEACTEDERQTFLQKAGEYVRAAAPLLVKGETPHIMCPLNEDGRCRLYHHRLMICRMHGVPNTFVKPDGRRLDFPGCKTCQALPDYAVSKQVLDRTDFYRRLAALEIKWLEQISPQSPRVRLTLAEMLVNGPPPLYSKRNP